MKIIPMGGGPEDFCENPECGHHEMNHANYEGLPRTCNQTYCPCRKYVPPTEETK